MIRGHALSGRGALNETPIIDQAIPIFDLIPPIDLHDAARPFQVRARLDDRYGSHASQSIWSGVTIFSDAVSVARTWLDDLDELAAADPSLARAELVAQSRPSSAADRCRVAMIGIPGLCDDGVMPATSPRQAGGGPASEDHLKCQLNPVDAVDDPAGVTAAQLAELRDIFPTGVCDWTRRPVGWSPTSRTWQAVTTPGNTVTVPHTVARSVAP